MQSTTPSAPRKLQSRASNLGVMRMCSCVILLSIAAIEEFRVIKRWHGLLTAVDYPADAEKRRRLNGSRLCPQSSLRWLMPCIKLYQTRWLFDCIV